MIFWVYYTFRMMYLLTGYIVFDDKPAFIAYHSYIIGLL